MTPAPSPPPPPHPLPGTPDPLLAFLDVGMTEFLLVAALFLLLFGADKVPDLARSVGRTTAQVRRAAGEFSKQLDEERGLVDRPGDAVPRDQRARFAQHEQETLARLRRAARDLDVDIEGKGEEELRAAIAEAEQRGGGSGGR